MNTKTGFLPRPLSLFICLALLAAPWPAWAQAARALSATASARALPPASAPLSARSLAAPAALGAAAALAPAAAAGAAAPLSAAAVEDAPFFVSEDAVRGKVVVMVGTKASRPFIMEEAARVAKELGLTLVLVDDPDNRANSSAYVPDSHFIAAPLSKRDKDTVNAIARKVQLHPIAAKADVVTTFMSMHAKVTGRITRELNAGGIPESAVTAADHKPAARKLLNAVPELAVPYAELSSAEDARREFARVAAGGRVVLKTSRGENSRFLAHSIDTPEKAAEAFAKMDEEVRAFSARPEAKGTVFSQHPGIMMEHMIEKIAGSPEVAVEVVMQAGKAAFAIVSDTLGLGQDGQLAGGIIVMPGQASKPWTKELVAAAEVALKTVGIKDGSARLDFFLTEAGPKVIEINPFMGSVAIWKAVHSLTGVSLVEQGLRSLLKLKVNPGHAPDGVAHYTFLASGHTGKVEKVEGVEDAKKVPGVVEARSFVAPGDTAAAAGKSTYEEWGELIGKGKTWREAIAAAVEGARRMSLSIRKADGSLVRQDGAHEQPTPDQLAPAPALSKGAFWTKALIGFLSTFVLVSTAVESTSLVVSQMTEPLTQGFMALTGLTVVSYAFYTVGSFVGGPLVQRFGIANVYRAVLALRALTWAGFAAVFAMSSAAMPLFPLIMLFSVDYFFHSIGRVAEHSYQVAQYHGNSAHSNRFGSMRDFIEYTTVFVAALAALGVASFGFGFVIYPAPVAFAVAFGLAMLVALPRGTSAGGAKTKLLDGFRELKANKAMQKALLGYLLINSLFYAAYYTVATAFGAYVEPETPAKAAAVAAAVMGAYGIGAPLGALSAERVSARLEKETKGLPEAEAKAKSRSIYRRSTALSLGLTALLTAGTWAFMSQTVLFSAPWVLVLASGLGVASVYTALKPAIAKLRGETAESSPKLAAGLAGGAALAAAAWYFFGQTALLAAAWPIYPISLALLALGFASQRALVQLDTLVKESIPESKKEQAGSIVSATRTVTYASLILSFLLWGGAFALFGTWAFAGFAAFYTLAGGVYLWLARDYKKQG